MRVMPASSDCNTADAVVVAVLDVELLVDMVTKNGVVVALDELVLFVDEVEVCREVFVVDSLVVRELLLVVCLVVGTPPECVLDIVRLAVVGGGVSVWKVGNTAPDM